MSHRFYFQTRSTSFILVPVWRGPGKDPDRLGLGQHPLVKQSSRDCGCGRCEHMEVPYNHMSTGRRNNSESKGRFWSPEKERLLDRHNGQQSQALRTGFKTQATEFPSTKYIYCRGELAPLKKMQVLLGRGDGFWIVKKWKTTTTNLISNYEGSTLMSWAQVFCS